MRDLSVVLAVGCRRLPSARRAARADMAPPTVRARSAPRRPGREPDRRARRPPTPHREAPAPSTTRWLTVSRYPPSPGSRGRPLGPAPTRIDRIPVRPPYTNNVRECRSLPRRHAQSRAGTRSMTPVPLRVPRPGASLRRPTTVSNQSADGSAGSRPPSAPRAQQPAGMRSPPWQALIASAVPREANSRTRTEHLPSLE